MAYTQLVNPNLGVIGTADYCLAYVENVFAAPHTGTHNDYAWDEWSVSQYRHTGAPSTTNCVPVWFSWTGTVGGVTRNWGHVAVWVHGKVYTSPLRGTGHLVYDSIAALASAYGLKYVGWSEDLAGKRLVKPTTVAPTLPVYYTTVAGDTMTSIAAKFHLTLAQLESLNPLSTLPSHDYNEIGIGERIRVK